MWPIVTLAVESYLTVCHSGFQKLLPSRLPAHPVMQTEEPVPFA